MPSEFIINHSPTNKIYLEGKEFHFFSGTSYLGLNQNLEFQQLLLEGIGQYGMSFGSSRNGNLQLAIYEEAEQKLADWVGAESALTLSSGMLSGQVVAQFFNEKSGIRNRELGDKLQNLESDHFNTSSPNPHHSSPQTYFYSPQTHAANLHYPKIELPKMSFQEWTTQILERILQHKNNHSIIVCNSNDALKCTKLEFDWLNELPENQEITLIIDDSHGLGITGENGSGIFKQIQVKENINFIVVSSLHKAMGIAGGVVFGKKDFIQKLRHSAYFTSCSPIAPAYLYAYTKADAIYNISRKRLKGNIQNFISKIIDNQLFNFLEGFPVFYSPNDNLFDFLYQNQIFIYSFAYPIKTAKPNTRIVLSAAHQPEQIELLAEKSNAFQNY